MPPALKLATLTGSASILNFLAALFLASFYSAEAFGVFSTQLTIATLLSIVTTWRADYFSIQDNSFDKIMTFSLAMTIPVYCASALFDNGLYTASWLIGISFFSICSYKSIQHNNQIEIGFFRILNVAMIVAFQLYFYQSGELQFGLFYGAAIGSLLTAAIYTAKSFGLPKITGDSFSYFIENKKRFSATSFSWALENIILFYIPIYAYLFATNTELGYFNFADRFFKAPIGDRKSVV